jgi:hypothetical protein
MHGIRLLSTDYEAGIASVVRTNGEIVSWAIGAPQEVGLVRRAVFEPQRSRLEVAVGNHTITMDIGTVHDAPVVPVVYLDQNYWIYLAKWKKDPRSVPEDRARFFACLTEAIESGDVITPLSQAHMTETSKRGGVSRIDVATELLRYTRGWQLRDVVALRRAELRSIFGASIVPNRELAITLDPEAVLEIQPWSPDRLAWSPEMASLIQRITWASVLVNVLVDSEPSPEAGPNKAALWAQSFVALANELRTNERAKPYARDLTRIRFMSDLGNDLPAAAHEAGLTAEAFYEWLKSDAESALSTLPGIARLREVLHLRLRSGDTKWEGNDLYDWLCLSYAAGYCDLVLGEKKMTNLLRNVVGRVPPGATLHHSAGTALKALNELLDSGDPNPGQS